MEDVSSLKYNFFNLNMSIVLNVVLACVQHLASGAQSMTNISDKGLVWTHWRVGGELGKEELST